MMTKDTDRPSEIGDEDPKAKPLVSIIISNYNGLRYGHIASCLKSVFEVNYPNLEILVVDNASSDGSVEYLKGNFGSEARLRVIENPVNSYSVGLNLGINAAKGTYLVFLNNDTEVDRDFIGELVKVLEEQPDIGLAQGKLLAYANPKIIDSVGETIDPYASPITIGAKQEDDERYNRAFEILSASGSASITRRAMIEEVGGFDPAYTMGYEDMDYGLRVRLSGHRVVFVPSAIVYHKRGATNLKEEVRLEVKFHFNKNRIATIIKNYEVRNAIKALPGVVFYYGFAFLYESLAERDVCKAMKRILSIAWNLKMAKHLMRKRVVVQSRIRRVSDSEVFKFMAKETLWQTMRAGRSLRKSIA